MDGALHFIPRCGLGRRGSKRRKARGRNTIVALYESAGLNGRPEPADYFDSRLDPSAVRSDDHCYERISCPAATFSAFGRLSPMGP
jgi:hypothetical protein